MLPLWMQVFMGVVINPICQHPLCDLGRPVPSGCQLPICNPGGWTQAPLSTLGIEGGGIS